MQENQPTQPVAMNETACLSCGYNLIGVTLGDRCPECGSAVMQFASTNNQSSGKAITSMVLGILSIVTCLGYGILGIPCGIIAIVFAKKARLAVQAGTAPVSSLGMATAGKICGIIGLILSLIYFTFFLLIMVLALGTSAAAAAAGAAGAGPTILPF